MNFELLTLQELSLSVITHNFSRFTSAFSVTNDKCFIKNINFLQRAYSQHLFSELNKKNLLKEEHFDILLNEYLKVLDIGTLLCLTEKDIVIKKVIPIGHSITELICDGEYSSADSEDVLKALLPQVQNVMKICIPKLCTDELLELIATFCPQVTTLDIHDSKAVTGKGLKALCSNSNEKALIKFSLKLLLISDIDITPEDVTVLIKNMPYLQVLDYDQVPSVLHSIHKEDFENNVLGNIVKYNFTNLDFTDYFESPLLPTLLKLCAELCPHVKKLSVSISNAEELELCSHFQKLESLCLLNYKMSVIDLNNFLLLRGNKIKELSAEVCTLSVSILLENCCNLESLILKNSQYQKMKENVSKSLNHLNHLELDLINFSDENCTESIDILLTSSPNLKTLSLSHCDFSDSEIVAKISTFSLSCNLEKLTFVYSDVGVDLLQQIVLNCNSLKSLSLENCENISSEDIDNINHTVMASNRTVDIKFDNDPSEYSYSDYGYDFDDDYDAFDEYDCYYDDYYDCDNDDDDDDADYSDHRFW